MIKKLSTLSHAQDIIHICLGLTSSVDAIFWTLNPDGDYSVKSGTLLACQLDLRDRKGWLVGSSGDFNGRWGRQWELKAIPRVQKFVSESM